MDLDDLLLLYALEKSAGAKADKVKRALIKVLTFGRRPKVEFPSPKERRRRIAKMLITWPIAGAGMYGGWRGAEALTRRLEKRRRK